MTDLGGFDPDDIITKTIQTQKDDGMENIEETVDENLYSSRISTQTKKPLKFIKIDKSKIKMLNKEDQPTSLNDLKDKQKETPVAPNKIKIKLQSITKPAGSSKDLELEKRQSLEKSIEFQKQIDSLVAEKAKLNDNYQRQLQSVIREKEELSINVNSLEDKLQKMDLDREQLKLKVKQTRIEQEKNQKLIDQMEEEMSSLKETIQKAESEIDKSEERHLKNKKIMEERTKAQVDKLNDKIKKQSLMIQDKDAHVINLQTSIENKDGVEAKLRQQIDEINKSQN